MSFAEKGIKRSGTTKDGKRFFDAEERRMMDILNVPITVIDFVPNITTRNGDGRYCILFDLDGKRCKVITNSYKIKDVLDQSREAEKDGNKIFPVENVVIRRRSLAEGKSDYYFDE